MRQKTSSSLFSLYWQVLRGKYKLQGSLDEADSVVGLSFGMRCDETGQLCKPDPSNAALAHFIERLDIKRNLTKYLQHEITENIEGPKTEHIRLNVTRSKRRKQLYLDTYEVLRQSKIALQKDGRTKPVVVAHAYHVPRVVAVLKHMGFEPVVLPGLPHVWDHKSTQLWTRNYFFWIFRELLALILYKLKRYY